MIVFNLPKPPSTNRLYKRVLVANRFGQMRRPHTKTYQTWRAEAGWEIAAQRKGQAKIVGRYTMTFTLEPCGLDLGNAEKAVSDLLQAMGVIENDKLADKITLQWGDVRGCRVELEPSSDVPCVDPRKLLDAIKGAHTQAEMIQLIDSWRP